MKLRDLLEDDGGDNGPLNDVDTNDRAAEREVGKELRYRKREEVTKQRGDNYKTAKKIVAKSRFATKEANPEADDTTAQHGPNFSGLNFRR